MVVMSSTQAATNPIDRYPALEGILERIVFFNKEKN
jgi:hypothetical protein